MSSWAERERDVLRDAIVEHRRQVMAGVDEKVANRELWLKVGDLARGDLR
jgi:hypothetical protein